MTSLLRYNANGSLDFSAIGDGKVITALGPGDDIAFRLALQSDGKIVVGGYSYNGANNDFAVARFNSDLSLDASFDADGKLLTAFGTSNDLAFGLAIQTDGKIVVAGHSYNGNNCDFAVARYTATGSLDATFSDDGKTTAAIGTGDFVTDMLIQPDGRIIVAGYSFGTTNHDFAVARFEGTLPGDYNNSDVVDAADYVVWRKTLNTNVAPGSSADGNGSGFIDQSDYGVWRSRFGLAIEPAPAAAVSLGEDQSQESIVISGGQTESANADIHDYNAHELSLSVTDRVGSVSFTPDEPAFSIALIRHAKDSTPTRESFALADGASNDLLVVLAESNSVEPHRDRPPAGDKLHRKSATEHDRFFSSLGDEYRVSLSALRSRITSSLSRRN